MSCAWIYILKHNSGHTVKIGQTRVSPQSRALDYINTYQLNGFELYKTFEVPIELRQTLEKNIHQKLDSMGYRLSGIGGAREIFVCTVETAETIIIETIKKQDKIFKKLISGFKNKIECGFTPDFCYEEIEIEPDFYLQPDEFHPFWHSIPPSKDFIVNLFKLNKNKNFENEIKKINFDKFYFDCENFIIRNWYNYFKDNLNFCIHTNGYFPPFTFWEYIGALIQLIKSEKYFDAENKREIILSSWQRQIISLLDDNFVKSNNLYFSGDFFTNACNSREIKCSPLELDMEWIYMVAPYLKHFPKNKQASNLIFRLNRLGIIYLRGIEYLITRIIGKYQITDTENNFINYGGTCAFENFERGLHFHLKCNLICYINYLSRINIIEIFDNISDDTFMKCNEFSSTFDNNINLGELLLKETPKSLISPFYL